MEEEFKQMIYLFVDANIYIGSGYIFANDFFGAIEKYSATGDVRLLTCSICEAEVKKHIRDDVEGIVKDINKKLHKGIFYAIKSDKRYGDKYQVIETAQVEESLISGYETYLGSVGAESFTIEGISIESLMEDYYQMNPPFEPKKPKEFKDAIMIKALEKYQESVGEVIHVVSNDKGFRAAFLHDNNFVIYDHYKKFLQFLSRREEVCCAFEQYCQEDKKGEMEQLICDYIQGCEFCDFNRLEFEILNDVEIIEVQIEFLYCEITDKENVKIHISANVDINVNARYLDQENSYYDPEEKEYIYRSYMDVVEHHFITVEFAVNGEFVMDESDEQDLIEKYQCCLNMTNIESEDSFVELDETTFEDLISCDEYIPTKDMEWYVSNSVYCSECGKRIGFEGEESNFSYDEEPLCDDCMVDNTNGFVCPNCSRKYPETMRGNSGMFCWDCEQELDV